ncbi:hypothetical protein D3C72_60020 [compost metagenome]
MPSPREPHSRRDTFSLGRARSTGSFDAYPIASNGGAPEAVAAPLRAEDLAEAIREAETLFAAMGPRVAALARALEALNGLSSDLFEDVSEGEQAFTLRLADALRDSPDAARKARIAKQQFDMADTELGNAKEAHAQLAAGAAGESGVPEFSITKFRGMLHPIYNLSLTFHGYPLLQSLFPRARSQVTTRPLTSDSNPVQASSPATPPRSESGSLMQQAIGWFRGLVN